MRRLLKKSILNGIIRIFITAFYSVFTKFRSYDLNKSIKDQNEQLKKVIGFLTNGNKTFQNDETVVDNDEVGLKMSNDSCSNRNKIISIDDEEENENEIDEENVEEDYEEDEFEPDEDNSEEDDNQLANKDAKSYYIDQKNSTSDYYYPSDDEFIKFSVPYKRGSKYDEPSRPESPSGKKLFRFKTIFLFIFLIISYVCLNNYLIMFIYYKSSSTSKTSSSVIKSNSGGFWLSIFNIESYKMKKSYKFDSESSNESSDGFKILIDPLDIEVANLNKNEFIRDRQRILLRESYFYENDASGYFENSSLTNSSDELDKLKTLNHLHRPCMLPKLNPYDREIMQFVKKEDDIRCNPKKNWIYIENGTLRVSKSAIKKHGTIVCAYIPLYRGNSDFTVYEGNRIFPVIDKMPLITDFFKIDCRSKDGAIYSNIHSGIAYESSLHMRHMWNPMPKKALGYNVLMFGFDSVSRMSWIRMLPKSYEYMIKQGFIVLKGYNIVGDGTPQALLPILTGKKETELPEARRGFANANYVDSFPWIWKDYENSGYVTQWAEDMQSIGTFQLRMLGFRKQPVDHYMRVFYLEAERYYSRFRRLCLGSISRHRNMFNWVKEFFLLYDSKPKFSFIFHSEASHNYNNPLSLLDNDLKEFLIYLKHSGNMDNTILLFMSDHGMRISDLRQYSQGKLEERLPFFSVLMPQSFQKKHPNEMRNLRLNSRKLTTPFDIHETLKHFLNFGSGSNSDSDSNEKMLRGISLLKYIPANRTCEDAQIEAHWCSCLNWIDLNITSTVESSSQRQESNDMQQNAPLEDSNSNEDISEYNENSSAQNIVDPSNATAINSTLPLFYIKQKIDSSEYKSIQANLKVFARSVIKVANRAVDFINSLIDNDLELFCYKLRLHSIQKLSKLDINRKLLAFKMSKDIHGREALFDDLESDKGNFSNLLDEFSLASSSPVIPFYSYDLKNDTQLKNATNGSSINKYLNKNNFTSNMDSIYQIIFTTWPGNATYELSFKFNRFNGEFKFNKNEISRINSYNGTSNCMTNKRPDLRQYCFCKYLI